MIRWARTFPRGPCVSDGDTIFGEKGDSWPVCESDVYNTGFWTSPWLSSMLLLPLTISLYIHIYIYPSLAPSFNPLGVHVQALAACIHFASGRVPSVRLSEPEGQMSAPQPPYYRLVGLPRALGRFSAGPYGGRGPLGPFQVALMRYNAAAHMRLTRAVGKLEHLRDPCHGPARRAHACKSTTAKARVPGQPLLRRRANMSTALLVRTPLTGSLRNVSEACSETFAVEAAKCYNDVNEHESGPAGPCQK